ncbi:MAG: serine hydrolase domain-containing protein [Caldilineaceae bacterium]
MHDVLARHVDAGTVPGLVTLISRRGETHVDAIGNFAVDGDTPMQRDTIFRIASMTKPVTAVAALIWWKSACCVWMIRSMTGCRNWPTARCSSGSMARSTRPCRPTVRLRCATC